MPGMSPESSPAALADLLERIEIGDRAALDELFGQLYGELRQLAHRQRDHLRTGDTLCTTALVHETFVKLTRSDRLSLHDCHHFFSLAARAMRQVLLDAVRRRHAARRPPAADRASTWADAAAPMRSNIEDFLTMEQALQRLERLDEHLASLVEWRVFAGLTLDEISQMTQRSPSSLKRDWTKARLFLTRELEQQ